MIGPIGAVWRAAPLSYRPRPDAAQPGVPESSKGPPSHEVHPQSPSCGAPGARLRRHRGGPAARRRRLPAADGRPGEGHHRAERARSEVDRALRRAGRARRADRSSRRPAPVRQGRRPRGRGRDPEARPGPGRRQHPGWCDAHRSSSPARRRRRRWTKFAGARAAFVESWKKAIALSRQETVDGVEERDASRTLYEEQVLPGSDAVAAARRSAKESIRKSAVATTEAAKASPPTASGDRRRRAARARRRRRIGVLDHALRHPSGRGARVAPALDERPLPRGADHRPRVGGATATSPWPRRRPPRRSR